MNAVEIEQAITDLAEQPFDPANFPFVFLEAFGNKETTIKRLRAGASNKSDLGGVLQTNNIHNRKRVLAFVLVLRYTALRMSDVVQLRRAAVSSGRVLLRTTKTGATIYFPLPKALLEALNAIENGTPFYFWSGEGKLKSLISTWQRTFNALLELAKVAGHPHRYRHMLTIELLEKGITVEHVAAVLGNSPAIVYNHYSPWVEPRQRALEKSIRKVWT